MSSSAISYPCMFLSWPFYKMLSVLMLISLSTEFHPKTIGMVDVHCVGHFGPSSQKQDKVASGVAAPDCPSPTPVDFKSLFI